MTAAAAEPVRALLEDLIDYAGLFPPASLGMDDTVANFRAYRDGPERWILGRLVIPWAARDAFVRAAEPHLEPEAAWRLSILVPSPGELNDISTDAARLRERVGPSVRIESIELKVDSADALTALPPAIDLLADTFPAAEVFAEVGGPIGTEHLLPLLAAERRRTGVGAAKVRTGGITPDLVPPASAVAKFALSCAALSLPWKATAGLHHPLPAVRPLTYAPDAPRGPMFGYLGVLAGTALAIADPAADPGELGALLAASEGPRLTTDRLEFAGHSFSADALRKARSHGCRSIGSCSFAEPVDGAHALGLLSHPLSAHR